MWLLRTCHKGVAMGSDVSLPTGVTLVTPPPAETQHAVSESALDFVANLARQFAPDIEGLLQQRHRTHSRYHQGQYPDFLADTANVRAGNWCIAPLPDDLRDRRVEITGPVDRKTVINALNSGTNVFMADFEDATSPTWENVTQGQRNLKDAVDGTIRFEHPTTGRVYELADKTAVLMVRPRGWHLTEAHVLVDDQPIPAALFDFGVFFFNNARTLLENGSGPYFYLPKLESHLGARLWNDIFHTAQDAMNIPRGSIRATVLIETLPAAFQMDEILYELRDHSAGLNCGRWDYIFSYIKVFQESPDHVLPDRGQVTMLQPCMRAYSQLAVRTCHRRNAPAIGGMAAQIPIKNDDTANNAAMDRVRADKLREVQDGHDGTWVAHPGLVPMVKEIFDTHMLKANQIDRPIDKHDTRPEDLREPPTGTRTLDGLRHNIAVGVRYLAAWLGSTGCVPIDNLMEDAATAEISRAQVWQWRRHSAKLESGETVTDQLIHRTLDEISEQHRATMNGDDNAHDLYRRAADLFLELTTADELAEFLTLPAYEILRSLHR